jgi:hypothetical protein
MQVTIELLNQDTFKLLQQLERLHLLKLISFEEGAIAAYELDGSPILESELVDSVLESSKEAKEGKVLNTQELMKMLEL